MNEAVVFCVFRRRFCVVGFAPIMSRSAERRVGRFYRRACFALCVLIQNLARLVGSACSSSLFCGHVGFLLVA